MKLAATLRGTIHSFHNPNEVLANANEGKIGDRVDADHSMSFHETATLHESLGLCRALDSRAWLEDVDLWKDASLIG